MVVREFELILEVVNMIIAIYTVTHDQAVRSTQCLEVPVAHNGSVLVSSEVSECIMLQFSSKIIINFVVIQYLKHLIELGNTKMRENLQRSER